jgi:hypothetical protein
METIAGERVQRRQTASVRENEILPKRSRAGPQRHRAFHRPVTVQTGRIDRERIVLTTRDAAEVLLKDWPLESRKRARAMEVCLSVIRGEKPPYVARRAFVEAAREARVLVAE